MIQIRDFSNRFNQCFLTLGLIVLLVACGDKKKTNKDLQEAFKLHQEAVNIRNQTVDQLAILTANEDSLFIKAYKNDLDSISRSLKAWDEQLVEVPGFEEEHDHSGHDHDHDHDHDHGEQGELTPEQHLQVQQHLLQQIRAIEKSINQIKQQP